MGLFDLICKLLYPDVCIFCMKYSKNDICGECRGKLLLSCGTESENDIYKYGELFCYGKYVGALRRRFIDYKFKYEMWLGRRFGGLMFESFKRSLEKRQIDAVSFVPISDARFCLRGFNQSREMADEIAKRLGVRCLDLLVCVSDGTSQSKLGRQMRMTKVQGRFRVRESVSGQISKKHILLVDDIFTTGSTLNECGSLLANAGAVVVDGMVFASGRGDIN